MVLDPHAANHEWKGIRHIGAGMDYGAIAEYLQWYLDEIERRYKTFNRSGLAEEDWQETLRQQGSVTSVVAEEMTNWADRLPGDIGSRFFKSAISDSRKVLMPPLFVAHDRSHNATRRKYFKRLKYFVCPDSVHSTDLYSEHSTLPLSANQGQTVAIEAVSPPTVASRLAGRVTRS